MKMLLRPLTSVALTASLVGCGLAPSPAQTPGRSFQVYYLAVGSEHYLSPREEEAAAGAWKFVDLAAGGTSAATVADLLKRTGSPFGITLSSTAGGAVTRLDVLASLDSVLAEIKRDQPADPLIVYYFVGHGLSEGIGWNHFSIPGDLTAYGTEFTVNDLVNRAVYAGEVSDRLDAAGGPYMIILDNCRSGTGVQIESPYLGRNAVVGLKGTQAVLRFLNEFRGRNPVLFSTAPGSSVEEASDPRDPDGLEKVGPLGRRMLLLYQDAQAKNRRLTLGEFVTRMAQVATDPETGPAVTFASSEYFDRVLTDHARVPSGRHLARTGTGRQALPPVGTPTEPEARVVQGAGPVPPVTRGAGWMLIESSAGDYIGGGKRIRADSVPAEVVMSAGSRSDLTIRVPTGEESWELTFAAPDGQGLMRRSYLHATRAPFHEGADAGIDVTTTGRGCNASKGTFDVTELAFDASGEIDRFAAAFAQSCDGGPPLKGRIQFVRGRL